VDNALIMVDTARPAFLPLSRGLRGIEKIVLSILVGVELLLEVLHIVFFVSPSSVTLLSTLLLLLNKIEVK